MSTIIANGRVYQDSVKISRAFPELKKGRTIALGEPTRAHCPELPWDAASHTSTQYFLMTLGVPQLITPRGTGHKPRWCPTGANFAGIQHGQTMVAWRTQLNFKDVWININPRQTGCNIKITSSSMPSGNVDGVTAPDPEGRVGGRDSELYGRD